MYLFRLLITIFTFLGFASPRQNSAIDPQIIYSYCVNNAIVAHNGCTHGCSTHIGNDRIYCLIDCAAQYQADQCACDKTYTNAMGNPDPNCSIIP